MKKTTWPLLVFAFAAVWMACDNGPNFYEITYGPGVYITHEGSGNNGTVSYIKRDIGGVWADIYPNVNGGDPIGGKVYSLQSYGGYTYIITENKIVIVDWAEFKFHASIDNFLMAREMVTSLDTAYVTEWRSLNEDSGWVRKVSLSTNTYLDTLKVGKRPTKMKPVNSQLWVVNSNDSTLDVINPASFSVSATIGVDYNPQNLVVDKNGIVWVLCRGKLSTEPGGPTNGSLLQINQYNYSTINTFSLSGNPNYLIMSDDGEYIYYHINGGVYRMDVDALTLPSATFVDAVGTTSAMNIDPSTNFLYIADEKNGTSNGRLRWYNGSTGLWIDSSDVGVKPSSVFFIAE